MGFLGIMLIMDVQSHFLTQLVSMDYSGFNVSDWAEQNFQDHRKKSRLMKKAQTQTEKELID